MPDDFQDRVLGALGRIEERQDHLQEEVTWLKRNLGRVIVSAWQGGAKEKEEHDEPTFAKRRKHLRWAPLAVIALIGLGIMAWYRPDPETVERPIAGPTTTVTFSEPTDRPDTSTPVATRDRRERRGQATEGATEDDDVSGREPGQTERPVTATVTDRQTAQATRTVTRRPQTTGQPEPTRPPPASRPPPDDDPPRLLCASATVLGVEVETC